MECHIWWIIGGDGYADGLLCWCDLQENHESEEAEIE